MTIKFTGRAKRLEDIDLPRIGHEIGVGEDEIHAIIDVEAAGSGFDSKGRVKAAVLPVPVWAPPSKSCPASTAGMACAWIGVGVS